MIFLGILSTVLRGMTVLCFEEEMIVLSINSKNSRKLLPGRPMNSMKKEIVSMAMI
jgi:hypothetical protein